MIVSAAGGDVKLDRANIDRRDTISIQRGARVFVNYCLSCHSASYMRYNRLLDLGLSEQQIEDNLIFANAKIGDTMQVAMRGEDGKTWFHAGAHIVLAGAIVLPLFGWLVSSIVLFVTKKLAPRAA